MNSLVAQMLQRATDLRAHELRMRRNAANPDLPRALRYQAAVNATDLAEEVLRLEFHAGMADPRCR